MSLPNKVPQVPKAQMPKWLSALSAQVPKYLSVLR